MFKLRVPFRVYKRFQTTGNFKSEFESGGIVPEILCEAPKQPLEVRFDYWIKNGRTYKPDALMHQPSFISWNTMRPNNYNTLMIVDADYPTSSSPALRCWSHLLVVNMTQDRIHLGTPLASYIQPLPLEGTGLHRLLFLVFKQKGFINCTGVKRLDNLTDRGRQSFSIGGFCSKHGLSGIPEAGTFVYTDYDASVTQALKKLQLGSEQKQWAKSVRNFPRSVR